MTVFTRLKILTNERHFLLKNVSDPELVDAIWTVSTGSLMIEPSVARKVVAEFTRLAPPSQTVKDDLIDPLSEREIKIIKVLHKV